MCSIEGIIETLEPTKILWTKFKRTSVDKSIAVHDSITNINAKV